MSEPINSKSVDLLRKIVELDPKGEHRPQQETAVAEIEAALNDEHQLLIEAPTGSGKTLSYLIPLIITGRKAVVSTATKQLSEQITREDIPLLEKTVSKIDPSKKFTSALLKGRENYFCLAKDADAAKLEDEANSLFGTDDIGLPSSKGKAVAKEVGNLKNWAQKTKTGDRSEAPVVSDQTWRQYSSTSTECPGRNTCPFGDICFAEKARDKAKYADVVITNHAVVGHDLMTEEGNLLGDREAYIFDELHELDNYLSSAWGTKLSTKIIKDAHKSFKQYSEFGEAEVDEVERIGKRFDKALLSLEEGLITSMPHELGRLLTGLSAATTRISGKANKDLQDKNISEPMKKALSVMKKYSDSIAESTQLLLDDSIQTVRWTSIHEEVPSLYAAPLRVGPKLQAALKKREAIMIGTSATITVGGEFDIPVHNLSIDTVANYKTVKLDSPFDFAKQAMMFIPDPNSFPAPIGADRKDHTEAVKTTSKELIQAMEGRALVLSTTTFGAKSIGEYLRKSLPKMNILIQGEAPAAQLIEEFKEDEQSVLVATMGMWHGLNAPGKTASLIIIDKLPFKPMDDPLSLARQRYADESGRSGFMDVYVADANVMLAQGVGRLIRSKTDKGVVAILDTRLVTKQYGKSILKSLPAIKIFSKKEIILDALKRLASTYKKDSK